MCAHDKSSPHPLPFTVNIIKFPLNDMILQFIIAKEALTQHCEVQRDAIHSLQ